MSTLFSSHCSALQPEGHDNKGRTSSTSNLTVATSLAKVGLRVFPARAFRGATSDHWKKRPCVIHWQNVATSDPDQIDHWWKEFPDAIPAICCGPIVIDADRRAGGPDGVAALMSLVANHGEWPEHPVTFTPGGGEHHYFAQPTPPLGNRTGQLPDGIDVRGLGGFIIAPGAKLPDGSGWGSAGSLGLTEFLSKPEGLPNLPSWLERLIRTNRIPQVNSPIASGLPVGLREQNYAATTLEDGAGEIQAAPAGKRNTVLNSIAYRLGRMVGRGWIDQGIVAVRLLSAAANLAKDDGEAAVRATISSGLRAGCRNPHPGLPERKW